MYQPFGATPAQQMIFSSAVRGPQDMLSTPLGQHILDYDPPRGFSIPPFAMYDGSSDPYDHMLHYNQAMILNVEDDRLLCKVFPASLKGPALAWFHKLPKRINKHIRRTVGRVRLSILVLCQTKREHKLPPVHPQTGRRVHPRLHTQVRTSGPAD